jgi:hypothetical protein
MITFEINKPNVDTTPFRVKGHQTISGKKIDTMFVCYADNETAAKKILNEYKMTKLVKYNMRTLAKK